MSSNENLNLLVVPAGVFRFCFEVKEDPTVAWGESGTSMEKDGMLQVYGCTHRIWAADEIYRRKMLPTSNGLDGQPEEPNKRDVCRFHCIRLSTSSILVISNFHDLIGKKVELQLQGNITKQRLRGGVSIPPFGCFWVWLISDTGLCEWALARTKQTIREAPSA